MAFKADPKASTLRGELTGAPGNDGNIHTFDITFDIDVKNKPFSTPEHVAEALSTEIKLTVDERYEVLTSASKRRTAKPSIEIKYDRTGNRFWISLAKTKQDFHLRLENDPTSILTMLGFDATVEVEPGTPVAGSSSWTIGDGDKHHGGRSVEDQRIRSDPVFGELWDHAKQFGSKTIGKGKKGRVTFHAGHLLLAEYLFSLVFLSMYRENGRTMQITNAVEQAKRLDDRSATTFGEKLDQVCDFDVIATAEKDSCSIAMLMKEVKQARFNRQPFGQTTHSLLAPVPVICSLPLSQYLRGRMGKEEYAVKYICAPSIHLT